MSVEDEGEDYRRRLAAQVRELRTAASHSDQLLHELRVHQIELEIQNRALREAQDQLELSRDRYVELFEFAPMAYLTVEEDGRIIEANLTASRMLAQDRSTMIGRRFQTLVGMADPLAFRAVIRSAIEQKVESRTELTFRTSQQSFTVDVVVVPIPAASDPGHVRIALHDVTWRAAAEQNLRFLSQAGARLNRVPLGSPGLLEDIVAAGAFGSIDGCWAELEGEETVAWRSEPLRRKMMNGEALQLLRIQISSGIREAGSTGEAVLGRWTDEKGVRVHWPVVRTWVTAPLAFGGKVHGTVTLFQHLVPESEEAGRALTEEFARRASMVLENAALFRKAEEAARSRDEMMAVLGHDLSNALFSFRLHAQRGLSRGGEQAQRALGAVARGSQWLLGLVKTVLDVAGMQGGVLKVQPQPGNLSQVLESACLLQQMDADERQLEVVHVWPEKLLLEFDQERIHQVLFNLINNAVKFTPIGGRIEIGAVPEEGHIRVWVQDSGKGLGPGHLERVFERGWQEDPKSGGKGLGLYISQRIVEAHGGTMWVESTAGHGATFHVVLPSAPAAAASRKDEASVSP